MSNTRIVSLDIMQAIAMILVILGHHLLDFMPDIYTKIHFYIYTFHMPLFIFISGFLISYSYKTTIPYLKYIKKRFIKFFIPYLIIGIFVSILYYFLYKEPIINNIINLIISPKESSTTFLWYIYMLFFLYLLYPLIHRALENNIIILILVLIAIYLNLNPIKTPILCLDYFTKYFIFYLLGCISAKYHHIVLSPNYKWIHSIGLALFIVASIGIFHSNNLKDIAQFAISYLSIPSAYFISILIEKIRLLKKTSAVISKECFHIYLFHMFVIQGLALIFSKLYLNELDIIGMIIYIIISTNLSIVISIYFFKILNNLIIK